VLQFVVLVSGLQSIAEFACVEPPVTLPPVGFSVVGAASATPYVLVETTPEGGAKTAVAVAGGFAAVTEQFAAVAPHVEASSSQPLKVQPLAGEAVRATVADE